MGMAGFIYQCEIFPMNDRTLAVVTGGVSWAFGMFIVDFFAYFLRRWGHLLIALSLTGVLIIPYFW